MKMTLMLLACLAFSAIGCSIEPPAEPATKHVEIPKAAHSAETDPCKKFAVNAELAMKRLEDVLFVQRENISSRIASSASVATAYSSYYLVCRDLEKRK